MPFDDRSAPRGPLDGELAAWASRSPAAEADVAIVGGGIVGLAIARELCLRSPDLAVCVLERERELARHQTTRNSGVIHAGIYYAPGSLKAKLCVEGAAALYDYCASRQVPHRRCGKLVVARDASELSGLDEIERRARANLVPDLRRLRAEEIEQIEPHAQGAGALHSPHTGVVDFKALALCFARDIEAAGGRLMTGCEVRRASEAGGGLTISYRLHGESRDRRVHGALDRARRRLKGTERALRVRCAVFCAGAWSDRLAVACGADEDPKIVPFKGAYLRLRAEHAELVRSLIYPVPDPRLPFLGVHLTRTVAGEVLIGPTALIAGARDARARSPRVSLRDMAESACWPGTWRMSRRWWRTGLHELHCALNANVLLTAAARYVPDICAQDVEPAFFGIRAQALWRNGALADDFVISRTPHALHVRNAPSPAATSSLAIARHVVDTVERERELLAARD